MQLKTDWQDRFAKWCQPLSISYEFSSSRCLLQASALGLKALGLSFSDPRQPPLSSSSYHKHLERGMRKYFFFLKRGGGEKAGRNSQHLPLQIPQSFWCLHVFGLCCQPHSTGRWDVGLHCPHNHLSVYQALMYTCTSIAPPPQTYSIESSRAWRAAHKLTNTGLLFRYPALWERQWLASGPPQILQNTLKITAPL